MSKLHSVASNAAREARRVLGTNAKRNVHFSVIQDDKADKALGPRWFFRAIDGAPPVDAAEMVKATETPATVAKAAAKVPTKTKKAKKSAKTTKAVTTYLKKPKKAKATKRSTLFKRKKLVNMITGNDGKGASLDTITKALGWQKHTVRGAISTLASDGIIKNLKSYRDDVRGRVYVAKVAA